MKMGKCKGNLSACLLSKHSIIGYTLLLAEVLVKKNAAIALQNHLKNKLSGKRSRIWETVNHSIQNADRMLGISITSGTG